MPELEAIDGLPAAVCTLPDQWIHSGGGCVRGTGRPPAEAGVACPGRSAGSLLPVRAGGWVPGRVRERVTRDAVEAARPRRRHGCHDVRLLVFDRPGYGGSDRLPGRSVTDVAAGFRPPTRSPPRRVLAPLTMVGSRPWQPVSVVSTKWNGDFHRRTPSLELGSDNFGTWLWMPPGTIADTGSGAYAAIPGLRLIPVGQMWSAYLVPSSPAVAEAESVYVDITTPTRRTGDVFEFIDLDLDLEVVGAGPPTVLDRDEFTDHANAWAYPAATMTAAETTCCYVADLLANRRAPFDGSYLRWWSCSGPGRRPDRVDGDRMLGPPVVSDGRDSAVELRIRRAVWSISTVTSLGWRSCRPERVGRRPGCRHGRNPSTGPAPSRAPVCAGSGGAVSVEDVP